MGTNFYAVPKVTETEQAVLDKFKLEAPMLHIGKWSHGFQFLFHATDEIKSFYDWLRYIRGSHLIKDEYGKVWSLTEFIELVEHLRKFTIPYYHFLDDDGYPFDEHDFC